jgi:hypothetical protein
MHLEPYGHCGMHCSFFADCRSNQNTSTKCHSLKLSSLYTVVRWITCCFFSWVICRRCQYVDSTASNGRIISNIVWKEPVVAYSNFNQGVCLEGLRKATRSLSQVSWCPCRVLNRVHRRSLLLEQLIRWKIFKIKFKNSGRYILYAMLQ